jgi:hypothetical protein
VTTAEDVPLQIVAGYEEVTGQPADPAPSERVAEMPHRRGAGAAGLTVVPS